MRLEKETKEAIQEGSGPTPTERQEAGEVYISLLRSMLEPSYHVCNLALSRVPPFFFSGYNRYFPQLEGQALQPHTE